MATATAVAGVMRNRGRRPSAARPVVTAAVPVLIVARRSHTITGPPAAVLIAAGLVDPSHIAETDTTAVTADNAAREARQHEHAGGTHLPGSRHALHFGSCLVSASDHSM